MPVINKSLFNPKTNSVVYPLTHKDRVIGLNDALNELKTSIGTSKDTQDKLDALDEKIKVTRYDEVQVPEQAYVPYSDGTSTIRPTWKNDVSNISLTGTTSAVNEGTYTCTATPKTGYRWHDYTMGAKEITWKIGPIQITPIDPTKDVPKVPITNYIVDTSRLKDISINSIYFNDKDNYFYKINPFDNNIVTFTDNDTGSNIYKTGKNYKINVHLRDKSLYKFSDNTTDDKLVNLYFKKKEVDKVLTTSSEHYLTKSYYVCADVLYVLRDTYDAITFDYNSDYADSTINANSDGNIIIDNQKTSVINVNIDNFIIYQYLIFYQYNKKINSPNLDDIRIYAINIEDNKYGYIDMNRLGTLRYSRSDIDAIINGNTNEFYIFLIYDFSNSEQMKKFFTVNNTYGLDKLPTFIQNNLTTEQLNLLKKDNVYCRYYDFYTK